MPNITPIDRLRSLVGAFEAGATVRAAAATSGVSKRTVSGYRAMWLAGSTAEEMFSETADRYRAARKAATGGRYQTRNFSCER